MPQEPMLAWTSRSDASGIEVRVNFGIFAGREATPAELDDLARELIPDVGEVSIVAEHRHEVGDHGEASVHQVRVEVAPDRMPADDFGREALAERLAAAAAEWAEACIAERHESVTEL